MNIFTNLLFTLVFLNIITYLKFPDIENKSYLEHKFIYFICVFFFQVSLLIIVKIKNNCKIVLKDIIHESLMTGIYSVIGYSIYVDIMITDKYKDFVVERINEKMLPTMVCIIIIMFLAITKFIEIMFSNKMNNCIKQN
jgi:hypothetical protein